VDNNDKDWTLIIKPRNNLLSLNLGDIWKYRDLIRMFIKRDFVTFYKQTILGPLWFIIQPLFTGGMFALIFGTIAQIPTDGIPMLLFYTAGIINWTYFADCLSKTGGTFTGNAGIFGKVYFPRLAVPISNIISSMIRYAIQYMVFIVMYCIFVFKGYTPTFNWLVVFTPLLLIYMALISLGFGVWISSVTTKYRDFNFVLPFFVQLWMYATPVIFPLSLIPEQYRIFMLLNPVAPVIEIFRYAYLGAGEVNLNHILISVGITFTVLFSGIIMFNKTEKTFMDTV